MTVSVLGVRRVVRHSRRFFLVLCAWCQRALGPAGTGSAREPCGCAWRAALARQARARFETLGLPGDGGQPPFPGPRPRAGRARAARASRALRLVAA